MPKTRDKSGNGIIYGQVFMSGNTTTPMHRVTDGRYTRTAGQDAFRASFLLRHAPILHFALTAYPGHHPSEPAAPLIRALLQSHRVDDAIRFRSKETGEKEAAIRRRARAMAQKMSADVRLWAVKMLAYGLGHIWRWLFKDELYVDQQGLQRLSSLPVGSPVVYLPTHRSHLDYLLLSYVLFSRDITVPHIAAGDNLQIPLLGGVMRKGGAFFMRRSIRGSRDENVYKAVLAEYIQLLLQRGQSVEFFIEGGRGRDGKVCVPKLGLLSLVLDTVLDGHVPDVYLVPLAIDYEVALDEQSYICESLGVKKPRETLLQAVRGFWSALWRDNGRVFVTFSEPISCRDWLRAKQGGAAEERRSSLVGSETRHRLQDKLAAFHAASAEASPGVKRAPDLQPKTSVKDRAAVFQNGGEVTEGEQSPPPVPQNEKKRSLERRPSAVGALAAKFNSQGGDKPPMPSPQHAVKPNSRRPPGKEYEIPTREAEKGVVVEGQTVEHPENRLGQVKTNHAGETAEADRNGVAEMGEDGEGVSKELETRTGHGDREHEPNSSLVDKSVLQSQEESEPSPPHELSIGASAAEPLSVPAPCGEPVVDRVFISKEQRRELVGALGEELGGAIRRSVAATPTALVAAALLTAKDGGGLDREECVAAVDYVARQVLARGGQIAVVDGPPWSQEVARAVVEEGVRLLGPCVEGGSNRLRPGRAPQQRLTLQYHCNQLVHLFAGEALVACAFAAALSEPGSGDASRRRSILPRSKLADNARWLRRLMHAEFDPLIGAAETDPLWEEQLTAYLDRLVQEEAVLSLDGGRQLRPASLDPEGKSLEARGVLAFAAALVRPHIRTYAYALRCLLALQSRPPLPDSAVVAALQAACADPLLPLHNEGPLNSASPPTTSPPQTPVCAPSEDILPSVFILRGLLTTVQSLGLLWGGSSPGQTSPLRRVRDFSRVESVVDFAPLSPLPEAAPLLGTDGREGRAVDLENAPAEQLQCMAARLDGFAAPLRI